MAIRMGLRARHEPCGAIRGQSKTDPTPIFERNLNEACGANASGNCNS
jgi:hypothetical protein